MKAIQLHGYGFDQLRYKDVPTSQAGRWLVQRRLQEAHFLLKERGLPPSEVYLEVGFEDLSHFSFAFKKTYGRAPSKLAD